MRLQGKSDWVGLETVASLFIHTLGKVQTGKMQTLSVSNHTFGSWVRTQL